MSLINFDDQPVLHTPVTLAEQAKQAPQPQATNFDWTDMDMSQQMTTPVMTHPFISVPPSTTTRNLDEFEDDILGIVNKIPANLDKIRRLSGVQKVLQTTPDSSNDVEEVQIDSKDSSTLHLSKSSEPRQTVTNPDLPPDVQHLIRQAFKQGLRTGSAIGSKAGSVTDTMSVNSKVQQYLNSSFKATKGDYVKESKKDPVWT